MEPQACCNLQNGLAGLSIAANSNDRTTPSGFTSEPIQYTSHCEPRELTSSELDQLKKQDVRGLLTEFQRTKLEKEAAVNWDKFYKRNETRFFKDRHWTTREFQELMGLEDQVSGAPLQQRSLLEVGCGVGNMIYPLLEENINLRIFACDFSTRAVSFVKEHSRYDPERVNAFVADITKSSSLVRQLPPEGVDLISCVFVLSAISPDQHSAVATSMAAVSRPGTVFLFRDYAVNDMAMVRFRPGSKIADRFYVRQDGTRAYYFTRDEVISLFAAAGFVCTDSCYVHRRTTNKKEGVDAPRLFVQAKFSYQPR